MCPYFLPQLSPEPPWDPSLNASLSHCAEIMDMDVGGGGVRDSSFGSTSL